MESLFDVPHTESVTVSKPSEGLKQAWKLWCKETSRPRQLTPDKKFAAGYRNALTDNMTHEDIMEIISVAKHLPPRGRDPKDTRRVVMALSKPSLAMQARKLYKAQSPVYSFPQPDDGIPVSDLAQILGTPTELWSITDHEYAAKLCSTMSTEDLNTAVAATQERYNKTDILPHEVIKSKSQWTQGAQKQSGRRVHYRGRKEREEWSDVLLDVDAGAQKMFLKGVPHEEVMRFHNLAPEGFWQSVYDKVNKGMELSDSMDEAQEEFGWEESSRYVL